MRLSTLHIMLTQIAKETNANVDLRTGIASRGVLATAILSSVHGHLPGIDDDDDDNDDNGSVSSSSSSSSSSEDEEDDDGRGLSGSESSVDSEEEAKKKQAKKMKKLVQKQIAREEKEALALEAKGGVSSQVCGVLELVNTKSRSRKFNKKAAQVAELVANEVASLMAHRAREVAFLDPTHGLEAALGAFAIEGSSHGRRKAQLERERERQYNINNFLRFSVFFFSIIF
jgi:hypothetical protein